jgi:isocitrate dehydrogenase
VSEHTLTSLDIPFIKGDGIGPEIADATADVLHAAIQKAYNGKRTINLIPTAAGESAFKSEGDWLPEKTVDLIREKRIALKGPLMTPVGKGQRSINVRLRKILDLYACIRPVKHFPNVPCPVKNEILDVMIFRENTEDVYRGIEYKAGSEEAKKVIDFLKNELGANIPNEAESGIGIKPISVPGSARIARAAIRYAIKHGRKRVTLIHKGNIMKFTEGLFRDVGYDVAESEFGSDVYTQRQYLVTKESEGEAKANADWDAAIAAGKIIVDDVIADAGLMHVTMHPERFDVLVLPNLNGDYFSDASAGVVGGLGVAPGANVNFETDHGLFEATHGTAPDIAGKDMANPSSMMLSACMLLDHVGWVEASALIRDALHACFEAGTLTADLAPKGSTPVTCSAFTQSVLEKINA